MKTIIITFQKYTIALAFLLIGLSGCKNNPVTPISSLSTVSGTITLYDQPTGRNIPLPGIKVYLININFKVDTVNYENNKAAFVDSAVTDSNGNYTIANIKAGNYAVTPSSEPGGYQFTIVAGSDVDSLTVSNSPKNYSINFTAPNVGTVSSVFTIRFISKNVPTLASGWNLAITLDRTVWIAFVPGFELFGFKSSVFSPETAFQQPINFIYPYGWTCLFYTLSNQFEFRFMEVSLDAQFQNIYKNKWTTSYDLTLSNCPALAIFEVDWTAHTLKRIQ